MMGEPLRGMSMLARAMGVMATLLLVAAACGGSDTDSTSQGVAESEVGGPTTAVDGAETTSAAAVTTDSTVAEAAEGEATAGDGEGAFPSDFHTLEPSAEVPERLVPGLTYAEIKNLLIDMHGPTDDIAAEMNRLTVFPTDIPTPPGSNLYDFNAGVQLDERYRQDIDSEVRLIAPNDQDEVVALYESALPTAGYTLVSSEEESRDGFLIKSLEFDSPTTPTDLQNGVDIETVTGDFDGTFVTITVNANPPEGTEGQLREAMVALQPYFGNAPVPDGGTQEHFWVQSFVNTSLFGFHWLSMNATWAYPAAMGPQVAQGVLDSTAGSDYEPVVRDGEPDHAELIATAEQDDIGFAILQFRREGEFNGPNITLRAFYDTAADRNVELILNSGSTDLFGNYESYGQ